MFVTSILPVPLKDPLLVFHRFQRLGHLQLVHGADRLRTVPPQSQRHRVAGGTLCGGAVETSKGGGKTEKL